LSQLTDRKCVGLRAVFSDGTVDRWEGSDLQGFIGMQVPGGEIVDMPAPGSGAWDQLKPKPPTTTRPHRKVTTLCGCHYDAGLDGEGIADRDVVLTYHLGRQILPPEALGETDGANGPLCDYLIEVEAIPAKEEQP
jgi:hypothetical protein